MSLYYQAIYDPEVMGVSFGDPTALSFEPLLTWINRITDAHAQNDQELEL